MIIEGIGKVIESNNNSKKQIFRMKVCNHSYSADQAQ